MRNTTAAKSSVSRADAGADENRARKRHTVDYSADAIALTVADAAAIAGICKTTLYHALRWKQLPARKIGRRTLILRKDLDHWLESLPRWAGFPDGSNVPGERSS